MISFKLFIFVSTPTVKDNISWPKCRSITLHQIRREVAPGDDQSNGEEAFLDDVFFNEPNVLTNNYSQDNSLENFSTLDSNFTYNDSVQRNGENSFAAMSKIPPSVLEKAIEGRQIGRGFIGGFFTNAEYRKSRLDSTIKKQMDHLEDHRPYFTCWVTFVQIVCYIFAIFAYDLAPFGISMTTVSQEVLMPNLAIEESSYSEENNVWLGLRQADLIHMGAKYAGCMRADEKIRRYILKDREYERETSCCIRLDGSGCYQASEDNCSFPLGRHVAMSSLTNWKSWRNGTGPSGRSSGSVCHQDPRYCLKPLTPLKEHNWTDDITKWPVCQVSYAISDLPHEDTDHMTCDITGRPCCIGIRGQCIITTREDCDFKRGFYHQNISLCSQVACLEEVCGMIPFINSDSPDQFYRLFISLFIHAGVVHLLVTVVFQLTVMRDLEKLAGSSRIGIIYIFSGIAGNLTSAIFLPHIVEAGPSGSQFGLLACLFVEVIQNWYILKRPILAIMKLSSVLVFLFLLGLMPMIDNFAHLGGFIFGFLLSFTFLPYITFNMEDKRAKTRMVVTCFVVSVLLLSLLFLLFYVVPINNCSFCHYINCVPITSTFCRNMELNTDN